ncbi:hypothetical protein [Chakrabartyella piscis]|uniref:hypothetical protein n=1 Tax=Chakrabartyella piscis TaxID=2918914 RepID=UPI0029587B5B|nr:hypothetical protein [Chakrabartyella piscis]
MGKFLTFVLCIVAFAWCGIFGINMQNAKSLKEPVVLLVQSGTEGVSGTVRYGGLGYEYYVKSEVSEDGIVTITQTKMTFIAHIIGNAVGENVLTSVDSEEVEEAPVATETVQETVVEELAEEIAPEELEEVQVEESIVAEKPEPIEIMANLYYPDDQLLDMQIKLAPVTLVSAQDLVDVWLLQGGISDDIQVISFANGTMDLNQAFADFISHYGSSGELMYIEGFAQTVKECYGLSELYLTIEGNVLETGHSIYDFPL